MWTEKMIPNLQNKVVFITGANSGIGFEKAKLMAKHSAHVVMGVRSVERGNEAIERIKRELPSATIELVELDLSSKESIQKAAELIYKRYDHLDILMNNAGIMTPPYQSTKDGFESQIGVNHLGHFYFTSLVFDLLKKGKDARIINTASIAHSFGNINITSFKYKEGNKYNKQLAYAQSKLANLLFTYKLSRLVEEQKVGIKVVASHPGISKTNLGRHIRGNVFSEIVLWIAGIARQDAYMGALPGMRAAVSDDVLNGDYYGPRGLFHTKGFPKKHSSNKRSRNKELQDRLWEVSEKLLGIKFTV